MRWFIVLIVLVLAPMLIAETPASSSSDMEGAFVLKRPTPAETAKPRIDRLTWTLLAADGGARALDAYSTRRMLKNSCSSGQKMVGVSTCNYEQNLPGFIANSAAGIYAFDGAIWATEFLATKLLIRYNHRRIARFIPFIDFISTTSFAVNNLTLSIGEGGAITAASTRMHFKIR
jgi:hypothetical protein